MPSSRSIWRWFRWTSSCPCPIWVIRSSRISVDLTSSILHDGFSIFLPRRYKWLECEVRSQMFELRNTWHGVFSAFKLYQLDTTVNFLNPVWPIPAQPLVELASSIHVTPIPNVHLPVAPKPMPTAPVVMVNPVPAIPPKEVHIKPVNRVPRRNNVTNALQNC